MASLQQLQQNFRNTTNRQSQIFLLLEEVDTGGPSYGIDAADETDDHFTVSGDQTGNSDFADGEDFYVVGSSGNDGLYRVASTSLDGSGNTEIFTIEDIVDSANDGTIYVQKNFEWRNLGRISEASLSMDVDASDPDQHGRESTGQITIDFSLTWLQASNTELAQLPNFKEPSTGGYGNYLNGHTFYLTGKSTISESDINAATDSTTSAITYGTGSNELDDPNGLRFDDVLPKPAPDIDLNSDQSIITIEFTGEIYPDGSSDF